MAQVNKDRTRVVGAQAAYCSSAVGRFTGRLHSSGRHWGTSEVCSKRCNLIVIRKPLMTTLPLQG
jgi:hypothetical protein